MEGVPARGWCIELGRRPSPELLGAMASFARARAITRIWRAAAVGRNGAPGWPDGPGPPGAPTARSSLNNSHRLALKNARGIRADIMTSLFGPVNAGLAVQARERAAGDPIDADHPKSGWRATRIHIGLRAHMAAASLAWKRKAPCARARVPPPRAGDPRRASARPRSCTVWWTSKDRMLKLGNCHAGARARRG